MLGELQVVTTFKRFILSTIEKTRCGKKYLAIYKFSHHLEEIGWLKSTELGIPVDKHGKPLPWYTYPIICFLEKRVKPWMRIFEYGSGNSTLWWSELVSSVISIEHNRTWFDKMKKSIPANVDYRYCELIDGGNYCKVVSEYGHSFDIIIIDGRDRINCAKNALSALAKNGIIIWDNSDRDEYLEGYNYLIKKDFKRLDFLGYGPINTYSWCTSIFYRDDNWFGI